jgi:hypothetical protein
MLGEKRGQGIRMGNKCLWDSTTDCCVSAAWENENIFAFCTAYGVYYY